MKSCVLSPHWVSAVESERSRTRTRECVRPPQSNSAAQDSIARSWTQTPSPVPYESDLLVAVDPAIDPLPASLDEFVTTDLAVVRPVASA